MVPEFTYFYFFIISLVQCQEFFDLPQNESLGYIYSIKPQISNEKIVQEITRGLTDSNKYDIVLPDIISLYKLQSVTKDEFLDILNTRNPTNYTKKEVFDLLEFLLQLESTTFNNLALNISKNLGLDNRFLSSHLDYFNINKTDYTEAVLYEPGKDFQIIKNGVYNDENIEKFIEDTGKTKDEVFVVARNEFVRILNKANLTETQDFLAKFKMPFEELFKKRPFTLEDLNSIPTLANWISQTKNVSSMPINGLAVTAVGIIINKMTAQELEEKINIMDIEISNRFHTFNFNATSLVSDLKFTKFPIAEMYYSVPIADNQNDMKNCSYILLKDDNEIAVPISNLQIDDVEIVGEIRSPEFVRGGALVCHEKAYGLARLRNISHIVFDNISTSKATTYLSNLIVIILVLVLKYEM